MPKRYSEDEVRSDDFLREKGLKPAFPFTDRERFIQIMTVMVTSQVAKKIPRDARKSIIDYLRKKYCPSITDQVWHEITLTMDHNNKVIMESMLKGTTLSMEIEASTMQDDPTLTVLDREIRESFKSITDDQWNALAATAKEHGLSDLFNKVFKQKKDYDEGR
ncbi:uncharacterized protein METZ01_LOCUS132826 [marine metagenome]|uniref:Uncharacterized protein n=1 Tax=marine metagenome TaxID=408172 RepID=A0A381YTM1_9ZZZZ